MAKMIQLTNVPDALHWKLKARAAVDGKALSEFLVEEVRRVAERPTIAELRERLHKRRTVKLSLSLEQSVREEWDWR